MKFRSKTIGAVLALTFMLLFSAVAFASARNGSMAIPTKSSAGMPAAGEKHWNSRNHHRHHHHRHHHKHR